MVEVFNKNHKRYCESYQLMDMRNVAHLRSFSKMDISGNDFLRYTQSARDIGYYVGWNKGVLQGLVVGIIIGLFLGVIL